MSYKSGRALDGYTFDGAQTAFVTPWIDVHSAPFVSFKVKFSSGAPDGYFQVQDSDDIEAVWTDGKTYPRSAQFTGTYGTGPNGDPTDLGTVYTSPTPVLGSSGVVTFSLPQATSRWYRLLFNNTGTGSAVILPGTVTVTFAWKTTS